jgi:hypothetical protein
VALQHAKRPVAGPSTRLTIGRDERPRSGPRGLAVTSAGGAGQMAVTSGRGAVRLTDAKLFGHFCTFLHMCKTVSHTPYAKTFSLFGARFRCFACLSPCVACVRALRCAYIAAQSAQRETGDKMEERTRFQAAAEEPRTRDYTQDARRDLGNAGTTFGDVYAYAWCAREGAYHVAKLYTNRSDAITRYDVCERPNGVGRNRGVRLPWPTRIGQKRAGANPTVRVATIATARNSRVRALA